MAMKKSSFNPCKVYLAVGDETVVTKAGAKTFGLDRFFSSILGKPVPGVSCFTVSLISVKKRCSSPLDIRQLFRSPKEDDNAAATSHTSSSPSGKAEKTRRKAQKKRTPKGRPKGSKHTRKEDVELSPYLLEIQGMLTRLLQRIGNRFVLVYVGLDGAFGNNYALQMVRRCGLHLISKLQYNSALYFPYTGSYSGRGPRKKYGKNINSHTLPQQHLKHSSTDNAIRTDISHMPMRHKLFPQVLNIVIIVKTNLTTQTHAHVILFARLQ